MAVTGFFHHIGTFFLFAATVFLVIVCITAPVVNDIGILKVDVASSTISGDSKVVFGTFGWCITDVDGQGDMCSPKMVGYDAAQVMSAVEKTDFSDYAHSSTEKLTKVMILHPVAAGLTFIAFALSVGAGFFGSLLAAMVSGVAFLVTVIVLICDFVLFSIIRSNVNDDGSGSKAYFAIGIWLILVSGICSLIGTIIVFLTCCSSRLHRQRNATRTTDAAYAKEGYGTPARRRRWF